MNGGVMRASESYQDSPMAAKRDPLILIIEKKLTHALEASSSNLGTVAMIKDRLLGENPRLAGSQAIGNQTNPSAGGFLNTMNAKLDLLMSINNELMEQLSQIKIDLG